MSAGVRPVRITVSRVLYLLGGAIGVVNGAIELGPDARPSVQAAGWPLIVSGAAALVLVVLLRRPGRGLPVTAGVVSAAMGGARVLQAAAVGSPAVLIACLLPVVALLGVIGSEGRAWTRTPAAEWASLVAADRARRAPRGVVRRAIGGLGAVGIVAAVLVVGVGAGVAAAVAPCPLPGPAARSGLDTADGTAHPAATPTGHVTATDGVRLAYYAFVPRAPRASLVFYHGTGANSAAGYLGIGETLRAQGIAVYLFDIRGHGASGGPRGDTPSTPQLEQDTASAVSFVHHEQPDVPEFVGGHSAGAGVVLNSVQRISTPIAGYVFLAPDFGLHSGTERQDDASNFATICQRPLIAATLTNGLLGAHTPAVSFAYTSAQIAAGLIPQYTAAMAIAQNADDSAAVLAHLRGPVGVWIGGDDEVFDPSRVAAYAETRTGNRATVSIVPHESHLGILDDPAPMGEWILAHQGG
ncbi:Alpha/beta hydrolase family protein [Microbacterium sp. 8M]|uniref:alpha/beta hydrolase n=1 Tax=Microbacterium sp. 8M TaxID=2653153 RepID=UPI0012F005FB|nr:alpha/beta fold hydrolase [Microbacterium sp. 8M]VXB34699.1 Alpha/beta hydrolase family protein [Microbacterium sp. 8M]